MSQMNRTALGKAREAYGNRAWEPACLHFDEAAQSSSLETDDLDAYAISAYLAGQDMLSVELLTRSHKTYLDRGEVDKAVRSAFRLGMILMDGGDMAQGGGWLARAHRLLEERHLDCVEQGYLLIAAALQSLGSGDAATAQATFGQAEKIGQRFSDNDLVVLGRLGRGQTLTQLGEVAEGLALLDEVMVAVTAGEVSEIPAGVAYCTVIEVCSDVFDFKRAREWTEALSRWCDSQPDLKTFRGQCLARRAEVMQMRGEWDEAAGEAQRAVELLDGRPAVGLAWYVQAELYRLRGRFSDAEHGYREAHAAGRMPHPGLSQLRLAQGRVPAACSGLKSAVEEAQER
ncbi:MAG: DNA-binding response regulator, partial [Actinomycetota bacterium]